ncbi:unnamed protein product [Allacma fusca]|uniref:Cytosolic fatty-acid binding proteins domain-containing protein n=1 Tax=Allacma fusca TaxID=39272 RepID=A0A8J2LJW4_9HEXA|nr:unnamed protein product [Allacma fusca]
MSITGKYELVSSENFDEYLAAVGVNTEFRKLAAVSKPVIEITENGNQYSFKTITSQGKVLETSFEDGKEFAEDTPDGRKVQSTITRNGNVFVQVQKLEGKTATTTRTFADGTLTAVAEADGVTATRVYKRV